MQQCNTTQYDTTQHNAIQHNTHNAVAVWLCIQLHAIPLLANVEIAMTKIKVWVDVKLEVDLCKVKACKLAKKQVLIRVVKATAAALDTNDEWRRVMSEVALDPAIRKEAALDCAKCCLEIATPTKEQKPRGRLLTKTKATSDCLDRAAAARKEGVNPYTGGPDDRIMGFRHSTAIPEMPII